MTIADAVQAIIVWLRTVAGVHGPLAVSGAVQDSAHLTVAITPVKQATRRFTVALTEIADCWQVTEVL